VSESAPWKKCSSCKKDILYGGKYYLCSVSTCKHPRTGVTFCSVECWDAHLGYANHRQAWAEENKAPNNPGGVSSNPNLQSPSSTGDRQPFRQPDRQPVRKIVEAPKSQSLPTILTTNIETDTLVVVSKVKKLILDKSHMSTSQCFIDALTKKIVKECITGIEKAKESGRKTVMGRDILF